MASSETCVQVDNIRNVGGRTMFYASKVEDGRIRVVMYGRILFMTEAQYIRWESTMSLKNDK